MSCRTNSVRVIAGLVEPKAEQVQFEEITLKMPKTILDFISRFYGSNPKEHIEREIVNWIRVDLESLTGQDLAEHFDLQETFKKVLGETI